MRFLVRGFVFCVAAALLIPACRRAAKSAGDLEITPTSPPPAMTLGGDASNSVSMTVPSTDTAVSIPGYLSFNIPSGSLSTGTLVTISLTSDADTAAIFNVEAEISQIRARQAYEHRINIGTSAPLASSYSVSITLPSDFTSGLQSTDTVIPFAQLESEDDVEFEAIPSTYDSATGTLAINLASGYFSNLLTSDGSYEAVIVVAAVPPPPPPPVPPPGMKSSVPLAAAHAGAVLPAVSPKRVLGVGGFAWAEGLNSPLIDQLVVTSAFNPARTIGGKTKPHRGADLAASVGTPVIAAADGVVSTRFQPDKSGKMAKYGYGIYAINRHPDGSNTVYAHLSAFSATGWITKGHGFASSGQTGGADPSLGGGRGPHLHFELIPWSAIPANNRLPDTLTRIDPMPYIQKLGLITGDPTGASEPSHSISSATPTVQLQAMGAPPVSGTMTNITEDSSGNPIGVADIQWSSDTPQVATVDRMTGLVSAVDPVGSPGTATITATQSSSTTSVTLQITVDPIWDGTYEGAGGPNPETDHVNGFSATGVQSFSNGNMQWTGVLTPSGNATATLAGQGMFTWTDGNGVSHPSPFTITSGGLYLSSAKQYTLWWGATGPFGAIGGVTTWVSNP